jgi:hypothetical protein
MSRCADYFWNFQKEEERRRRRRRRIIRNGTNTICLPNFAWGT